MTILFSPLIFPKDMKLSHYGDILAIPFFILSSFYFYTLPNKTLVEYVLLLFSVVGAVADTLFTFQFLSKKMCV
jgi:hypothetical protein